MTRLDPFTHAFGALADSRLPEIRAEARADHRDTTDRSQFAAIRSVQHLLGEVESPELLERHPEAAAEYVTALWVAYRFWEAGCHVYSLTREDLEERISNPGWDSTPVVPHRACYARLPEHWFWAQIDPGEPHEPLDGFFVVEGRHAQELSVLAVLGLRSDRAGFSQIAVTAVREDLEVVQRALEPPLFIPTLEGGAEANIKSVSTTADLLSLACMALQVAGAME